MSLAARVTRGPSGQVPHPPSWSNDRAEVVAALEAPTVVAGLDDIAVVGQSIEQRGRHLGITEYALPFAEGQVGGDEAFDSGGHDLVEGSLHSVELERDF